MTLAIAQAVATAVSSGGVEAIIRPVIDSGAIVGWEVQANAVTTDIALNQAKTFQDAHLVMGSVRTVIFR